MNILHETQHSSPRGVIIEKIELEFMPKTQTKKLKIQVVQKIQLCRITVL